MKSLPCLFGLCLLALWGCRKDQILEEKDPVLGYITNYTIDSKTKKYHGPYTRTDSTGRLLEKGHYDQGELHGFRELYYPDGRVNVRERYKLGQMDDLYEYFHPNGQLELSGYYVEGAMYGLWKKFDADGKIMEEVTMVHNEENGPFREYHPNGRLKAEGAYLNGPNEDGTLKLYDESGQLQKQMLCDAGWCYTQWQKE